VSSSRRYAEADIRPRPLVSVIVPVYNGAEFLREALASVVAQDYAPMEIIVIDDGSTDETAQVAQAFVKQSSVPVQYVYQENRGPAAARNHGLKLARGDLIAFQDADDVWMPDKLSSQISCLKTYPDIQYVVCRVRFFLGTGCQAPPGFRSGWLTREPVAYLMQALLARRQLFDQIGQFDPALSPADDVDWFARVFDSDIPGYVVPRVLLHKRIHDANISHTALDNNQLLLAALRRSVLRKRQKGEAL
jgi:glycosyltransferase involved in cell wall biosynthesis